MHKPLWSYIFSAGRFLSFDITGEIRFFTPSHMDHRNSSSDKDSPEARPYTRAAPLLFGQSFRSCVYIHIIMIYRILLRGMFNFLIYFLGVKMFSYI